MKALFLLTTELSPKPCITVVGPSPSLLLSLWWRCVGTAGVWGGYDPPTRWICYPKDRWTESEWAELNVIVMQRDSPSFIQFKMQSPLNPIRLEKSDGRQRFLRSVYTHPLSSCVSQYTSNYRYLYCDATFSYQWENNPGATMGWARALQSRLPCVREEIASQDIL